VDLIDISEVARRCDMAPSALRFYEEKRLITPVGRRGQRRVFEPKVLDQLAFISLARAAGFSLDEIATMLSPGGKIRIDRSALIARAAEIDDTVRKLAAISDGLKHAAACRAANHFECPTFRRYLDLARAGSLQPIPRKHP
jgi:DNA-binding transcriptional MerR regulator